ncbi:hypothetical protein, partial [Niveispirillum sp.]|uniref:hypothetical protein n=1 Tax=Niveispirillum sp. TaxID=1917217 RepID=UPI001B692E1B
SAFFQRRYQPQKTIQKQSTRPIIIQQSLKDRLTIISTSMINLLLTCLAILLTKEPWILAETLILCPFVSAAEPPSQAGAGV